MEGGETNPNAPVKDTVLYLAYGSNLAADVFQSRRGIKPLTQRNVLVPELELCFDLAGIPYNEPCFADTRLRTAKKPPWPTAYRQNEWKKGLVEVVYEVTKADYAKIIATEGPAYHDIVVLCFELPRGTNTIDPIPRTLPFPAHTLFSQSIPTEPGKPVRPVGRVARPDPDYAQASARYLKHITNGAAEHNLPREYQNYLLRLTPYTVTSRRQTIGRAIYVVMFFPMVFAVVGLGVIFAEKEGRIPYWLAVLSDFVLRVVWVSYDRIFKPLFGDGERTQERQGDEEALILRDSWDEKTQWLSEL